MTARFDHIAYGVEDPEATFPALRGALGLTWVQWDHNIGFSGLQASFPNGFKIEVLHPVDHERNPFLRRFLDRRGNGPHHVTFRVEGIERYLDRIRELGIEPVATSLADPAWREAFVHPKGGIGILVQLAESDNDKHTEPPASWLAIEGGTPARAVRLEQEVGDISGAEALLTALDGQRGASGEDGIGPYLDMVWQGDRIVRLRQATDGSDGVHRALVVDRILPGTVRAGDRVDDPTLGATFEVASP